MKLLLCPKGLIGITIQHLSVYIETVGKEPRGYALVREDIATELLQREGYEIIPPKQYPRDLNVLYQKVRKTLRNESLEHLNQEVQRSPNLSVSTQDFTIKPCWICRVKYWIHHKLMRKRPKSN